MLEFHVPTIRHEKKWYHAECYKPTVEEKIAAEEIPTVTQPKVQATVIEPAEQINKATIVEPQKEIKKKEYERRVESPVKKQKEIFGLVDPKIGPKYYVKRYLEEYAFQQWFHSNYPNHIFYEAVGLSENEYKHIIAEIQQKPQTKQKEREPPKLTAGKVVEVKMKPELIQKPLVEKVVEEAKTEPEPAKKTKELKIEKKRVTDLEKLVVLPKVKLDPVLILISCVIFGFLIWAPFTFIAGFSVGAMIIGGFLVIYQLLDVKRWSKSKFRHGKHLPGIFSILLLTLPFVFGGVLAYEGYTLWESAYRAVILWGFTITFWSVMLMVPLALYSKNKEEQLLPPMRHPMISIIIPAYNEEKVIANTIESVLEIDYPKKEVIVVDDGSKDSTLQIAKRYERDNVKVLHKENGGKATALNYGIAFAKGEIIAVLDADTVAGRSSLKEVAKVFEDDSNIAAVAGNIKVRNKVNWLTWCQALEYVAGLQIARRLLIYLVQLQLCQAL